MDFHYDANEFASFLSTPQKYDLDLSNATLDEVISKHIEYRSILNPLVYKQYSSLRKQLRVMQDEFKITIMPMQVNDVFWAHFIAYQRNIGKLALSTIKTNCGKLSGTLEWASRHRCSVSPTFDFYKLPQYSHDNVALTQDEISHIYHFDINSISKRPQHLRTLERVRDMFVLSCNLGCRYSDMSRIDKTCFDRNHFKIVQQKTGGVALVDIDYMSIDSNATYKILEKYDFQSPYPVDNTAYNRYLKELLRHIGHEFNDEIKVEYKSNGSIETKLSPKWKMITSHTARRTFITCNAMRGKTDMEIRRASGHKTSSAMDKYLCFRQYA